MGNLTKNMPNLNIAAPDFTSATSSISKSLSNVTQQIREQTGSIEAADITELPEDYIALERRVDALRAAHLSLLKIAKVYDTETYDYPTQVN